MTDEERAPLVAPGVPVKQAREWKGKWFHPFGDCGAADVSATCLAWNAPVVAYGWNASRGLGLVWWKEALKLLLLTCGVFALVRCTLVVLVETQCEGLTMLHPRPSHHPFGRHHGPWHGPEGDVLPAVAVGSKPYHPDVVWSSSAGVDAADAITQTVPAVDAQVDVATVASSKGTEAYLDAVPEADHHDHDHDHDHDHHHHHDKEVHDDHHHHKHEHKAWKKWAQQEDVSTAVQSKDAQVQEVVGAAAATISEPRFGPIQVEAVHDDDDDEDDDDFDDVMGRLTPEERAALKRCMARVGPWAGLLLAVCVSCFVYAVYLAALRRRMLRERFGIEGSFKQDVLLWCGCAPCALAQETRTLMHNNVEEGLWHGPLMGAPRQVQPMAA